MNSDKKIIELIGNTAQTAREFGVSLAAVSRWKKTGIPKARLMYLEVKYPHLFPKPKK